MSMFETELLFALVTDVVSTAFGVSAGLRKNPNRSTFCRKLPSMLVIVPGTPVSNWYGVAELSTALLLVVAESVSGGASVTPDISAAVLALPLAGSLSAWLP